MRVGGEEAASWWSPARRLGGFCVSISGPDPLRNFKLSSGPPDINRRSPQVWLRLGVQLVPRHKHHPHH